VNQQQQRVWFWKFPRSFSLSFSFFLSFVSEIKANEQTDGKIEVFFFFVSFVLIFSVIF